MGALGQFAQEELGTVHIFVNNAGEVTRKLMLADVAPEEIS
jgi:NAD(P)-dependent dehydrogenase (short-subunit alcohol dehydrogenase family)